LKLKKELIMLKLKKLIKISTLTLLFFSGVSYAQFNVPPVTQQCWPAFANYSNCQQIGSSARGAAIEFCKNASATWVSSGCAAQTQARTVALNQCAQQMGVPPEELPPNYQQACQLDNAWFVHKSR
jgi:hypothetical protein